MADIDDLVAGTLVRNIELDAGGDLYVSPALGVSPQPNAWSLRRGTYRNLHGYWIYGTTPTNSTKCWQARNSNGAIQYWNQDGKAYGDPQDWELFVFEMVDAATQRVKIRQIYGTYVKQVGGSFTAGASAADASVFTVEFD